MAITPVAVGDDQLPIFLSRVAMPEDDLFAIWRKTYRSGNIRQNSLWRVAEIGRAKQQAFTEVLCVGVDVKAVVPIGRKTRMKFKIARPRRYHLRLAAGGTLTYPKALPFYTLP